MYLLCPGMYIIPRFLSFSCTYFARECTSSRDFSHFHVLTLPGNVHHPATSLIFMYLLCPGMYIIPRFLSFSCTYFARECTSSADFSPFHVLTLPGNVHHPAPTLLFMYLLCSGMYIIPHQLSFSCTYFARKCTSSADFSPFHVLTLLGHVHHPLTSPLFMYLLCSDMYIIR